MSRNENSKSKISNSKLDNTNYSFTVGSDGPVLLQDTILHEALEDFVNEKMIERSVHTKGYGAFGYFITQKSMKPYTSAEFLQTPGQKIQTFSRFSLAVSNKGTPDTSRNVRGFSTKFYTNAGVFDLLCNHIPVFLVRDSIKFPAAIKSLSPSPINNLLDPSSFWKFVSENPESVHFLLMLYSDLGTIDNLRRVRYYGVNTYVWKNAQGKKHYVKYHWIPLLGEKNIDRQMSVKIAGENPNIAGEDLYNTIANGKAVEFDLCVQLMSFSESYNLSFDPLDDTKVWSEDDYPLISVGKLVLNKNVDEYKNQVEKVAFSPANLLEGIELSDDRMLQGRSFIYWDAQRRRLGPDFRDIPINHMKDWNYNSLVTSGVGNYTSGIQSRNDISKPDNFSQASEFYRSLSQTEKDHLIDNIASDLKLASKNIQKQVLKYLCTIDDDLGINIQNLIQ